MSDKAPESGSLVDRLVESYGNQVQQLKADTQTQDSRIQAHEGQLVEVFSRIGKVEQSMGTTMKLWQFITAMVSILALMFGGILWAIDTARTDLETFKSQHLIQPHVGAMKEPSHDQDIRRLEGDIDRLDRGMEQLRNQGGR